MEFNVIDSEGNYGLGTIITIFQVNSYGDKEYVLFSNESLNGNKYTLNVGYLEKEDHGYEYIKMIEDENELIIVINIIKKMIGDAFHD